MSSREVLHEILSLALAMLLVAGCSGASTEPTATSASVLPTDAPVPLGGGNRQIAFVSERDGGEEIYVMNTDGSGQTNLTNRRGVDTHPSMSPDGTQIVFMSIRDGNLEIYLINTDGTGLTQLTDTPEWEDYPVWSPDGKHIAFIREYDVWVMDPDGSNQVKLSSESWADSLPFILPSGRQMRGADLYSVWMPGGAQVLLLSVRDRSFQFYTVNTDGTGLEMFDSGLPPSTFPPEEDVYLVQVVTDETYVFMLGAANQQMEDTGLALGEFPAWSPDGTRIVFHSNRDGNMDIYLMSADRSEIVRLTDNEAIDMFPTWSPDGKQIAFASDRDGDLEIYVMNADGTEQTQLTDNSTMDSLPSWYP